MKKSEDHDIEKLLKSVALKSAPTGLREKILGTAQKRKEAMAWMTPVLWKSLAGCVAVLAVIFTTDAIVDRTQSDRLQALLGGARTVQSDAGREWETLREDLGSILEPAELAREKRLLVRQKEIRSGRDEKLSGVFSWEDLKDNEITKNLD
jgi:hypothetical protein